MMDWIGPAVQAASALMTAIGVIAPSVESAMRGGRTEEQWSADTHAALRALPEREQMGGDSSAGKWDGDLTDREKRG